MDDELFMKQLNRLDEVSKLDTDEIKYGIPSEIWPEFFNKYEMYDEIEYTGKEFVYVKDTKTIYWLEKNVKMCYYIVIF